MFVRPEDGALLFAVREAGIGGQQAASGEDGVVVGFGVDATETGECIKAGGLFCVGRENEDGDDYVFRYECPSW